MDGSRHLDANAIRFLAIASRSDFETGFVFKVGSFNASTKPRNSSVDSIDSIASAIVAHRPEFFSFISKRIPSRSMFPRKQIQPLCVGHKRLRRRIGFVWLAAMFAPWPLND